MPIGSVSHLIRWLEAAGCLVIEEDFGTTRVDGLSQWIGDHPVILINSGLLADRKRLTLAHELGPYPCIVVSRRPTWKTKRMRLPPSFSCQNMLSELSYAISASGSLSI
ncbi:MAG: ImmA/IrrE family metallo-endopeptidase [Pseudonocardiaceae bacterium]